MGSPSTLAWQAVPAAAMVAATLAFPLRVGHAAHVPPRLIVLDKPAEQIVVAKAVSYRQSPDGKHTLLQYDFFAEFVPSSPDAGGVAQLITPGGEIIPFRSGGSGLAAEGLRNFQSIEALNARVPNGRYAVRYTRPGARAFTALTDINATATTMPAPFRIRLAQGGHEIAASAVDPSRALTIQYRASSSDTSPGLTFVHVADCYGRRVARTAKFSGEPELTYRGLSYSVPENTLDRGSVYQLYVEAGTHVLSRTDGVPVFASYPVTVFMDFNTAGEGGPPCPSNPYQMDSRQTDRSRAP